MNTKGLEGLFAFFDERNPFTDDLHLRNIVTGVTAEDTTNAENAKSVGTAIVNEMVGKCVAEHSFKKKNQVVTMASNNAIKVNQELILGYCSRGLLQLACNYQKFQYKLSSYPPALFDLKKYNES